MELGYHPLVKEDALRLLQYYHGISRRLANEFEEELCVDHSGTMRRKK